MAELTTKQNEVLDCIAIEQPKILITYGAKRAGKTFVVGLGFLSFISNYENQDKSFILGGATLAAIQRNILNDWESLLGVTFKFHKDGHFKLFGNKIYCFGGDNAASWKAVRGFTAQGAFLNEATALHESFVKECISRCSEVGAVIYMDTNPENPLHFVKTDYVDKSGQRLSNGKLNIVAFHFKLDDNTALNKEYVESIKAATPSGVFYQRDIEGKWVSPQGIVYSNFSTENLILDSELEKEFETIFCGVDWGYSHKGSITVIGACEGNFYLIKEIVSQYKEIDWWVKEALKIKEKFGNVNFYCDSARPEHVARFQRESIKAFNANKKVIAGIEVVSKLFKTNRLFINSNAKHTLKELELYAWNDKTGEVIKTNDDALDSIRYAIYSYYILNQKYFKF